MSDRSGQNDTDNSFAGISFEGVNAVPPQSGENGDTINLADVADVSEQDDVSNAATETMPPLNFASDQTQPFQSFPTAGAAETTPAGTVPNGAVPTGAIPTGDMPSSTPAPAIPVLTMPVEGEAVVAKKRKLPLIITGIVLAVLVVAAIAGFFTARWYFQDKAAPGVTFGGTSVAGQTADQLKNTVTAAVKNTTVNIKDGNGNNASGSLSDFGVSYNISKNTPISQLIQSRLPISIRVGGMAVTLGAIVGLVLGIIAALKRDTIFDTLATIISVIGVSVPSYVIALALSYTFGFKLKWFPMLFSAKDVFGSSVLPSISLSMFTMASIARFTRSEMIEVLDSDYMLLAESKGISGPALIFRHALRNALIPIITVLAPLIVDLMTGSLVVEKIFAIPGVGSLLVTAIQSNDYNVVIGLSFIYSAMYIGIMLVVDLLYGIIDPRIRLAKGDD